jgi:hypothetical protein
MSTIGRSPLGGSHSEEVIQRGGHSKMCSHHVYSLKNPMGKMKVLILYAIKNYYNPLGQFRRNTINIVYVFLISLIKIFMEKIKR